MNVHPQVYTWGKGYCGALGHGNEEDVHKPKIVRGLQDILAVQVNSLTWTESYPSQESMLGK